MEDWTFFIPAVLIPATQTVTDSLIAFKEPEDMLFKDAL